MMIDIYIMKKKNDKMEFLKIEFLKWKIGSNIKLKKIT